MTCALQMWDKIPGKCGQFRQNRQQTPVKTPANVSTTPVFRHARSATTCFRAAILAREGNSERKLA
jgi:hypothetical protein